MVTLKSDHVGIERLDWSWPPQKSWFLKSDHVGIERKYSIIPLDYREGLKSDHVGIERYHVKLHDLWESELEIRPCWDWKVSTASRAAVESKLEIRPCWDWKLSVRLIPFWTESSLKSDHVGIERSLRVLSWDIFKTWNQTMLGLKVEIRKEVVRNW